MNMQRAGYIDIYLFIAVLAIMMFSVGLVYSASSARFADTLLQQHTIRVIAGIFALMLGTLIDYHYYQRISRYLMIGGVILLALVLVPGLGVSYKGATRWLDLGVEFQPSEYVKYALAIHISALLAQKQEYIRDFKNGVLPILLWSIIVAALIFRQPNFSTGTILLMFTFIMLFVGRADLRHLAGIVFAGVPVLIALMLTGGYRKARLMSFLGLSDGTQLVEKARYQIEQAVIAFGSGGLWGVGMGQSQQKEFFLPEPTGDFIFAIAGEEYGFIGVTLILAVFVLILFRGLKIARQAPDDFGRYLAFGITTMITMFAVVNVVVTSGLAPTTGLPMPFISYGGTAILFNAFAVGVLLNISMFTRIRPRKNIAAEPDSLQTGTVMK